MAPPGSNALRWPIEGLVRWRVAYASMISAAWVGGVLMVICFRLDSLHVVSLVAGMALLGPAQLLRAAATLRRSPSPAWRLGAREVLLGLFAIILTAFVAVLFALGLGADSDEVDSDCRVLGLLVAVAAHLKLAGRGLSWASFPREAAHRRVKSKLVGMLAHAAAAACASSLLSAMLDGSSLFSSATPARLFAAIVVLASADLQAEYLEDCTALDASWGMPFAEDLIEALKQPLACEGPGLGRWAALTALAQAIAYRSQDGCSGAAKGSSAAPLPPLASEVFSSGGARPPVLGLSFSSAEQRAVGAPSTALSTAQGRSFFAVYLGSGLEVLREFTVQLQCLAAASWRKGPKALLPPQLAVLETGIVELLPLMRISASGLSGWICLSRDFDEAGVVQREEALQKVIYELCGVLCAIEGLWPLRGVLDMSPECSKAAQSAQEEARHSLEQLLLAFHDAGLRQVSLPPLYKRFVDNLGR
ncbi:unnamed protein product [Polarella glacialis]|uniref:Uncharacterized protein n=1 Tax=Polarella glacialis TaxID=89957 RepID=A0A813GI09_POLGL|nr:unnamed protein product [Polarella glacialis]